MKNRRKKWTLSIGTLSLVVLLSGCIRIDQSTGKPAGFISQFLFNYFVQPTQAFIDILYNLLGSYGLAIIAITILVRILILPLTMKQQRMTTIQKIKLSSVKPVVDEIQAEIKESKDPKKTKELKDELDTLYREQHLSMLGGLVGCLPLLIQLPVFTTMFQAIRMSNAIQNATFLGMALGAASLPLALLTGLIYYINGRLTLVGSPEKERKQANKMMLLNPLILMIITFTSPAGLGLYWFVGGCIAVIQSAITTFYYEPKTQKNLKENPNTNTIVTRKPKSNH